MIIDHIRTLPILLSLISLSFIQGDSKKQLEFGKYTGPFPSYSYQEITIFKDSTFIVSKGGCTYSFDAKGKWTLRKDTLIAIATQERDPRWNKPYKTCEPDTFQYLIYKGNLLCLEKDQEYRFYISDTLIRNREVSKVKKKNF
jgi:hypothetical protein